MDNNVENKKQIYHFGRYECVYLCKACGYSYGTDEFNASFATVCPSCGIDRHCLDNKYKKIIRRWISTSPWWRIWRQTGYWEYKE